MIDETITELTPLVGVRAACTAVGRSRASYYRRHRKTPAPPRREPARQPRALSEAEQARVFEVLHSERFVDMAPAEVHAVLLDEGTYLCSVSTMYRLLRRHGEVRERRRQATHPARVKPELVAEAPNRVWSCYADVAVMPMSASVAQVPAVTGAVRSAYHSPVIDLSSQRLRRQGEDHDGCTHDGPGAYLGPAGGTCRGVRSRAPAAGIRSGVGGEPAAFGGASEPLA